MDEHPSVDDGKFHPASPFCAFGRRDHAPRDGPALGDRTARRHYAGAARTTIGWGRPRPRAAIPFRGRCRTCRGSGPSPRRRRRRLTTTARSVRVPCPTRTSRRSALFPVRLGRRIRCPRHRRGAIRRSTGCRSIWRRALQLAGVSPLDIAAATVAGSARAGACCFRPRFSGYPT